jgi:hypothetical protein
MTGKVVTLGAVGGVLGVAGLPNLKDIKIKYTEFKAEENARNSAPTGMLLKHLRQAYLGEGQLRVDCDRHKRDGHKRDGFIA